MDDSRNSTSSARWLRRRAENVAVALLCVMFATFIIQIVARYVFNNPVGWTDEVIITTWLWTRAVGRGVHPARTDEIRFDIIYSQVSRTNTPRLHGDDRRRGRRALRHLAAGRLQLRQLHEGRAVGLSARADQLALSRLHHFQRRLHLSVTAG